MPLSWWWGGWYNPKVGLPEERRFHILDKHGTHLGHLDYLEYRSGFGQCDTPWGDMEIEAHSGYGHHISKNGVVVANVAANPSFTRIKVAMTRVGHLLEFRRRILSDSMFCDTPHGRIDIVGHRGPITYSDRTEREDRIGFTNHLRTARSKRKTSRESRHSFDWDILTPAEITDESDLVPCLAIIISYNQLKLEVPLHR
jgi:hypothetical protein